MLPSKKFPLKKSRKKLLKNSQIRAKFGANLGSRLGCTTGQLEDCELETFQPIAMFADQFREQKSEHQDRQVAGQREYKKLVMIEDEGCK